MYSPHPDCIIIWCLPTGLHNGWDVTNAHHTVITRVGTITGETDQHHQDT